MMRRSSYGSIITQAALRDEIQRDLVPFVGARPGEHDLGAVAAHALDFDSWGGLRHHDHRRCAQQAAPPRATAWAWSPDE